MLGFLSQNPDCSAEINTTMPDGTPLNLTRNKHGPEVEIGVIMIYLGIFLLIVIISTILLCCLHRSKRKASKVQVLADPEPVGLKKQFTRVHERTSSLATLTIEET